MTGPTRRVAGRGGGVSGSLARMAAGGKAALSANHLAALMLPPALRRLYIACDAYAAGQTALAD